MRVDERILKFTTIFTLAFHSGGALHDGQWFLAVSCIALIIAVSIAWGMSTPNPKGQDR